ETLAKPTCRYHIVNVLNRFKSLKFEVTRIPEWRKATFEVEEK
ncbi:hypothetical protein LCGC14_2594770, partial [marine sediment metagenome]